MSENVQVTKRAGLVSFYTVLSRIGGLVRDGVIAYFFGTTHAADAFWMAFTIPNLLRRFVGEGALTIAFVPVFTEVYKKSREEAYRLACVVTTYLSFILIFLTMIGIAAAPWIVTLIAYGFKSNPEKFALTVLLTRISFPYIFLISLAALAMGILNSLKRFSSSSASPILLNIGLIVGAFASPGFDPPILGLAYGVLLGGLGQLLLQWIDLARLGWLPKPVFGTHPALWKLLGLLLPAAYGAAVYQINVIIVRLFASFLPSGSVSYLWYADRLFEFPVGVFAIAVATAILPTLSDQVADKNMSAFQESLNFGIRFNFLITLPAMVGLITLAEPLVTVIYQRGLFTSTDTLETANTLIAFAVGLPFLGGVRILVPAFYALNDAKKPVMMATVAVVANLFFASLLVTLLKSVGLALALSLAACVNFCGLLYYIRKYLPAWKGGEVLRVAVQAGIGSAVMGGALHYVLKQNIFFQDASFARYALELLLLVVAGVILFFLVAHLLRCREVQSALALFQRRSHSSNAKS